MLNLCLGRVNPKETGTGTSLSYSPWVPGFLSSWKQMALSHRFSCGKSVAPRNMAKVSVKAISDPVLGTPLDTQTVLLFSGKEGPAFSRCVDRGCVTVTQSACLPSPLFSPLPFTLPMLFSSLYSTTPPQPLHSLDVF